MSSSANLPQPAPWLSFRQGERPKYFTERPIGVCVFAVVLARVPLPPEPREPSVKDVTVLCAGRIGMDNNWGWVQLEQGTKEIIALDLEGLHVPIGKWIYMQMEYAPEEEIPHVDP
jgi:hypothetical protein